MMCNVNDHKTLLFFSDDHFNTILCLYLLKFSTHVYLVGQYGDEARLVLEEITNLPMCARDRQFANIFPIPHDPQQHSIGPCSFCPTCFARHGGKVAKIE